MPRGEPEMPMRDGHEPGGGRRLTLLALLIIIALVVGGLFVWQRFSRMTAIQRCMASGRVYCGPVSGPRRN